MNYHNKRFRTFTNAENGETSRETVFHYRQEGSILTSEYCGGKIVKGHLLGIVDNDGVIDMRYHQVNSEGALMTGKCVSRPEIDEHGKIRLYESWEWTSGDFSKGESVLVEL